MDKQQIKPQAHFSRVWRIFHERELLMTGLVINLSVIILFGLASNPPHLQTYAQLFEGREFEVPEQPRDCNGQCVYSYNSGGFFKKEAQPGGGIGFTPCQSATSCGGSNSGSGSSGGTGSNSSGNTANINNPNCATAVGCSQVQPNGNTIFCTNGLCTECTSGGSCSRAGIWPTNIVNNDGYCSGPGCAPGTTPPTNVQNCTTSCTGTFPGSGPGTLDYGQILIGGQLVIFKEGSPTSTDGKYTRTCSSAGSCTVSPSTQAGGSAAGGSGGGSAGQTPQFLWNVEIDSQSGLMHFPAGSGSNNICGSLSQCNFSVIYQGKAYSFSCAQASGGGYGCSAVPQNYGDPNFLNHVRSTNPEDLTDGAILLGTEGNPFYINQENLNNRSTNPCLHVSGEGCFVQTNNGRFTCSTDGCTPVSSSGSTNPPASGGSSSRADEVGGYGSGTYNDPYSAADVSVLINLCSTATSGCYGMIDGVRYECQRGSCGPARTPPGGVGSPITGKGGNSELYIWRGAPYGILSVDGSQPSFVCGDLVCSGNETSASCPKDCGGSNIACTVGQARRLVCE